MEREIIVLANSNRAGARCIAGICIDTGDWIRPMYEDESLKNSIPEYEVESINLLDIIKIDLKDNRPQIIHQKENYFINSTQRGIKWEKIESKMSNAEKLEYIRTFCKPVGQILHSHGKFTLTKDIEKISPEKRESLILIDKYTTFKKDIGKNRAGKKDEPKWSGYFDYEPQKEIKLSVTDPSFREKLNTGLGTSSGNYIMTISLAEPYYKSKHCCFKLIAGVIDPKSF